jgi:hypothetical protein
MAPSRRALASRLPARSSIIAVKNTTNITTQRTAEGEIKPGNDAGRAGLSLFAVCVC